MTEMWGWGVAEERAKKRTGAAKKGKMLYQI